MTPFGPLLGEVTAPESEKFTAEMVLVHGLWERAPAWRRFAGYLAHRGWHCIALERRAGTGEAAAHAADLRAAIATLDAAPVVVGHDLGANLALRCADGARAVIALAPLVGPPLAAGPTALQHAGSWLARRRGAAVRAPRRAWRGAYPNRDITEPAALVRQVLEGQPPLGDAPRTVPRAVFAMEHDEVVAASALQALARHLGAEFQTAPGVGHAVLSAPAWETTVAAVHRWIVQRLGVDLLALYEDAMNPE
jgi:alpha-beta hydrolase superfamily lysophospholipase